MFPQTASHATISQNLPNGLGLLLSAMFFPGMHPSSAGASPDTFDEVPYYFRGASPDTFGEVPYYFRGASADTFDEAPYYFRGASADTFDEAPGWVCLAREYSFSLRFRRDSIKPERTLKRTVSPAT